MYLFYGMPSCTSVRCRDCVVKNCSSTEYLHSSSTEYLRSSAKLARPRRWLEDLTCNQRTLQRRVEPRRGRRSVERRRGRRAIPLRTARDRRPRSRRERTPRLSRGRRAKRGEKESKVHHCPTQQQNTTSTYPLIPKGIPHSGSARQLTKLTSNSV